jgi:hypothetical protein
MSIGAIEAGRIVTSATTGSVVNLCPRDCTVIGFWANASTSVSVYDSVGSTGSSLQIAITACLVGFNRLPIALVNGLAVNQVTQVWFVVA